MNIIRIGTEMIDTRDGRSCVVSEVGGRYAILLRKRALGSGKWYTLRWEPGRFRRASARCYRLSAEGLAKKQAAKRRESVERYGEECVRLAEHLNLAARDVWAEREK